MAVFASDLNETGGTEEDERETPQMYADVGPWGSQNFELDAAPTPRPPIARRDCSLATAPLKPPTSG
jgi:hypothetical protein